ncbi:MAG: hypothetical protein RI947_748 [Candidatus Parcubacteria bacterium]|jgi:multidrug efflux pump subunit AcrA (membrane-fusion protein)
MLSKIQQLTTSLRSRSKVVYKRLVTFIEHRPLVSFYSLLGLIFLLIIFSNFLNKPAATPAQTQSEPKAIRTYNIGSSPKVTLQGQTEKTNVIQITALMSGVIQEINVTEGQKVYTGTNLIWMTTNYQGGNVFSLQRELAQKQYEQTQNSYPLQKDLVAKQRDAANKANSNTEELRLITDSSLNDTRSLISQNEDIVNTLSTSISNLEGIQSPTDDQKAALLSTKQMRSQIQGGLNQLRAGLKASEYQVNTDKPPTQLSVLQRDIALKQLEIQEKALDLGLEASRIQLQIAQVSEAMMHPVAPFSGTVQQVHVRVGQAVNPGTPLVTIAGADGSMNITVVAPLSIVSKLSKIEQSDLYLGDEKVSLAPTFVSQEATHGTLYSIKYAIPDAYKASVPDKGYVKVEIPIGYADTTAAVPFIPLESVYQSRDTAYVFVNDKGKAKSKEVQLGAVYGEYVQVESGIGEGDKIIIDRTVINGDKVKDASGV